MKWIERREHKRHEWHTGPVATYYTARKGGKQYSVSAAWNRISREGGYSWWSHDGNGTNKRWATAEAAMAWCEKDAAYRKEVSP